MELGEHPIRLEKMTMPLKELTIPKPFVFPEDVQARIVSRAATLHAECESKEVGWPKKPASLERAQNYIASLMHDKRYPEIQRTTFSEFHILHARPESVVRLFSVDELIQMTAQGVEILAALQAQTPDLNAVVAEPDYVQSLARFVATDRYRLLLADRMVHSIDTLSSQGTSRYGNSEDYRVVMDACTGHLDMGQAALHAHYNELVQGYAARYTPQVIRGFTNRVDVQSLAHYTSAVLDELSPRAKTLDDPRDKMHFGVSCPTLIGRAESNQPLSIEGLASQRLESFSR